MNLIDKDALVAEIERQILAIDNTSKITDTQIAVLSGNKVILTKLLSFLNTLKVKEIVDYEEPDLNPIFEEMGIEPDSKIAMAFRSAFYKGVDNFCKRKENKI